MKIWDRVTLAGFAVAVLVAGYLAGNQTEVVNVPAPKPATITVTMPDDFADTLASAYCEGTGGSWTTRGTCVYDYGDV